MKRTTFIRGTFIKEETLTKENKEILEGLRCAKEEWIKEKREDK